VYFVPAFSGFYAPYWKDSARELLPDDAYANKGHLARAVLGSYGLSTRDVVEAMEEERSH